MSSEASSKASNIAGNIAGNLAGSKVHDKASALAAVPAMGELVELAELAPPAPSGATLLGGKLSLLDSVPVGLSVVAGVANSTVGELMSLQESAILKLDRKVDYPVDVMLNGSVVARGQLVVVDEHFGVRITEIAQAVQP